jgi:transposase
MSNLAYWQEALDCALDESGASNALTPEQRKSVAEFLRTSAEMESECSGSLCIPNPMIAEMEAQKKRFEKELAEAERRDDIYRKNIAKRYGVGREQVHIESDGFVHIDPR